MADAELRRPEPATTAGPDAERAGRPTEAELAEGGLRLEVDGAVATVTLARPERRNAMTFATWRTLAAIGRWLPPEVRVVVLRGDGPSFSAGIDLSMFSGGEGGFPFGADDETGDRFIAGLQEGYTWLRNPEIVTVAAVHGHAIGGGFQLALACDIRIAAADAKFCMKEPALGLVPDLTGTKPLVEIVGVNRAMELCLTARTVDADEAARLGFVERVVPSGGLDEAVDALTAELLAVNAAAAVATKRLLLEAPQNTLDEQRAAERREQLVRLRELAAAFRG